MNTIEKRKEFIRGVMREFEKDSEFNWAYLTGVYASLLEGIAADKLSDTQEITRVMQNIMKNRAKETV